jgi:uncharacterized phage protein (TIGR02220 family)
MRINFFSFSIPNYFMHTRGFTDTEKGQYIELLITYMVDEAEFAISLENTSTVVQQRFNQIKDDIIYYKTRALHFKEQQIQKGIKSGQKRKANPTTVQPKPNNGSTNLNVNDNYNVNINENEIKKKNIQKKEKDESKAKALREKALLVLNFLNEKAKKAFRPVEANLSLIEARLKDGVTVQTCRTLICRKVRDWADTEQAKYLRPETLFNRTKCEQYIGEIGGIKPDEENEMSAV